MMRIFIILMILTRLMMENLVFKSFLYFCYTLKHNFWKIHIYSDLMPMCLCASWCKALKVATGRPEIQVLVIVVFKSNIIITRIIRIIILKFKDIILAMFYSLNIEMATDNRYWIFKSSYYCKTKTSQLVLNAWSHVGWEKRIEH